MADPSLLLLMQHLQRQPPAIEMTAASAQELERGSPAAFLRYAVGKEAECTAMLAAGANVRADIRGRLEAGTLGLTVADLDGMIAGQDEAAIEESKLVVRYESSTRRHDRNLDDDARLNAEQRQQVLSAHDLLRKAMRGMFDEGRDFTLFLRALRAELDPDRHGGSFTTSSPDELRAYLNAL